MKILDLLGRKAPNAIIRLFLEKPAAELQVKDIIKSTKLAKLSVLKWAKELARSGILLVETVGRSNLYSLNKGNPVVGRMRILYNMDYLLDKIKIKTDSRIFAYGSFARGENTEKSDIDLLVVGKDREVIRRLKSADSRIKVSFFTPLEWSMTARKDRAFFESVEADKIRLR